MSEKSWLEVGIPVYCGLSQADLSETGHDCALATARAASQQKYLVTFSVI